MDVVQPEITPPMLYAQPVPQSVCVRPPAGSVSNDGFETATDAAEAKLAAAKGVRQRTTQEHVLRGFLVEDIRVLV